MVFKIMSQDTVEYFTVAHFAPAEEKKKQRARVQERCLVRLSLQYIIISITCIIERNNRIYQRLIFIILIQSLKGGYKGCGHGHPGHPRVKHWSCCGSIDRDSVCPRLSSQNIVYRFTL